MDVPPAEQPRVSFVLVAYGTGPVLVDAIESIVHTAGVVPIEVIVVDNPHPRAGDRTFAALALSTRGVRVLRPESNLGFGGGCNAGAAVARGEYLALVNPDVVAADGWLEPLLALLDGDRSVWIAAPVLRDPDGAVQECGQSLYADATTRPVRTLPAATEPIDVDHASAACWVMRTADFRSLGGFDQRFHPAYFEDVDLVLRVRGAGGRCVVHPAVSVTHLSGRGTPDAPRPAHEQREILVAKWPELADLAPIPPSG